MPNKTTITERVKVLEEQIQQHQQVIASLKKEIEHLQKGFELTETDGLENLLTKDSILEFGTLGNDQIKGKIKWMNDYLICVTTIGDDDPPAEVLVFKHVLAYIRKPEEKLISRRGMYV